MTSGKKPVLRGILLIVIVCVKANCRWPTSLIQNTPTGPLLHAVVALIHGLVLQNRSFTHHFVMRSAQMATDLSCIVSKKVLKLW